MKIVKQSAKVLIPESPMKHIERIGRICYKSEDRISEGTDRDFVSKMYKSNHHAMLEHYRFIMQINPTIYEILEVIDHTHVQMTHCEYNDGDRFVISFNARTLMELPDRCNSHHHRVLNLVVKGVVNELITHIVKEYDCYELFGWDRDKSLTPVSTGVTFIENNPNAMSEGEWLRHGWMSTHMITDRGISHEIVRHREDTSFAQESTRYCNYGNNKFGKEITVINQEEFEQGSDEWFIWNRGMECAEDAYFELLDNKVKPQFARSVLPTCLKTEIVMTAPMYEWEHFFNLRMRGTTGAPHPLIQKLSTMAYNQMQEVFFNENKN